jgi:hypothetical protein
MIMKVMQLSAQCEDSREIKVEVSIQYKTVVGD